MQVSIENVGNLERRLTVSLPAERLEGEVRSRLREIARTARIKGFRPGKVPPKVIEQRYGERVRSEALGELVRETFNEAVSRENLRPAAAPDIQAGSAEAGEFRYVATFEVVPDFGQIDVAKLKIERVVASVEDADVERMIETLRQQRRTWEPVERAAQSGDLVMVETWAEADGQRVPAEGAERGATVVGSGVMVAELEAALIGMSAGDEKTVEVAFPADWRVEALAGKTAQVRIKAVRVSEARVPEVDAAFIESFGVRGGDLDKFRAEVRANLERELRGALMARLRGEVVDKLVAAYEDIEFPPRLIENEARGMARQAEQQARQQGQQGVTISHEAFLPAARKRVAAGLLVGEIARQHGLRLDPKRLNETLQLIASTYEDPQQVVDLYRQDAQLMQNLQARVMEEQVIDWIASHADATERTLSFDEVMRPGQAA